MNALINYFKTFFIFIFRPIIPYLPRRVIRMLGTSSGVFSYLFESKKKKIIIEELRLLLGQELVEKNIDKICLRSFCNLRRNLFEGWLDSQLNHDTMKGLFDFENKLYLDEVLKMGKGAIVLIAHFGNYKMILLSLGYSGYQVHQVAVNPTFWKGENRAHNEIMEMELEREKHLPANFIYIDGFLRDIFRALSRNEIIVISLDGPMSGKKISVPFLNRNASFSVTPVTLAIKTGTPIIPVFIVRKKTGYHRVVFEKPIFVEKTGREETLIKKTMEHCVSLLGHYVRQYPCHYGVSLFMFRLWQKQMQVSFFKEPSVSTSENISRDLR